MCPQRHLLCGTILSVAVYVKYKNPEMTLACLIGSVILDVDHIYEYGKYCCDYDVKPSFEEFRSGKYFSRKGTVYVIFHSWEIAIIGLIFRLFAHSDGYNNILKGLVLGYTSHMALDQIGNNLSGASYFWLYRWWKKWQQREFVV